MKLIPRGTKRACAGWLVLQFASPAAQAQAQPNPLDGAELEKNAAELKDRADLKDRAEPENAAEPEDAAEPENAAEPGLALQAYTALAIGEGLRLNNPYRLATPLGEDTGGLSRTAVYADWAVGVLAGSALGFQHGGQLALAIAVEGIPQEVLSPSYVLFRRWNAEWASYARLGLPVILRPDVNMGLEAGLGATYALTGALSASLELVYAHFYGAATQDVGITLIPVVAAQLGIRFSYEVLP